MSALWFQLITFICLSFGAPSGADVEGVVWRNVGQSITIQCRCTSQQESLTLKKGINEEEDIFYTSADSSKNTVNNKFTDRLQHHGKVPNVDILIKNLTLNDTGLYWCVYKMIDKNYTPKTTKGSGSVLLVVTENRSSCVQSQSDPVLAYVVICAAVVILVLTVSLLIVLKKKHLNTTARTLRDENVSGRANSHEDAL